MLALTEVSDIFFVDLRPLIPDPKGRYFLFFRISYSSDPHFVNSSVEFFDFHRLPYLVTLVLPSLLVLRVFSSFPQGCPISLPPFTRITVASFKSNSWPLRLLRFSMTSRFWRSPFSFPEIHVVLVLFHFALLLFPRTDLSS